MADRLNPFGDLGDLARPKPQRKPVEKAQIDQIAVENGFPSREPVAEKPAAPAVTRPAASPRPKPAPAVAEGTPHRRRHVTGRNQQINIKATRATIERFYQMADARDITLGELLDQALTALESPGQGR